MLEETKVQVLCSILYFYTSSSLLILYNKWLFVSYGFRYPLRKDLLFRWLNFSHLRLCVQCDYGAHDDVIYRYSFVRKVRHRQRSFHIFWFPRSCLNYAITRNRITEGSIVLPNRSAILRVVLLGLIVATDVSLSNLSYLYVTVSFMEMVKSSSPIWVRLLSILAYTSQTNRCTLTQATNGA